MLVLIKIPYCNIHTIHYWESSRANWTTLAKHVV